MNNKGGSHLKQNMHLSKDGKRVKFKSKDGAKQVIACVLILASLPFNSSIIMRDNNIEIVENLGFRDNYSLNQENGIIIIDDKNDLINYFTLEFEKVGLNNYDNSSIDGKIYKMLLSHLESLGSTSEQLMYLDYVVNNPEFLWDVISEDLREFDTRMMESYPENYILNAKGCSIDDINISLENIEFVRENSEIMSAINECSRDYGIPEEILVAMASVNVVSGKYNAGNVLGVNSYHWLNLIGEEYVMNFTKGEYDKIKEFYTQFPNGMNTYESVRLGSLIYAACLRANDRDIYRSLAAYQIGTSKLNKQNDPNVTQEILDEITKACAYADNIINYVIADNEYGMETELHFRSARVVYGKEDGIAYIRSEYAIRSYYEEIMRFIEDFVYKFRTDGKSR